MAADHPRAAGKVGGTGKCSSGRRRQREGTASTSRAASPTAGEVRAASGGTTGGMERKSKRKRKRKRERERTRKRKKKKVRKRKQYKKRRRRKKRNRTKKRKRKRK